MVQSAAILLGATGFSYLLNTILLRFSRNFGVKSRQEQASRIRWATAAKPTTGGISFFITFLFGAILLLVLRPELLNSTNHFLALFFAATLAFFIGFADDAYSTNPLLKFVGQIFCGLILLAFDVRINFFEILVLDSLLTVFWVVALMNSLNMLDNMDAVTATVALSIIITTLAMAVIGEGISNMFFILIAVAGSFMGFLFLNWKPASLYMGDTGSMFIGLFLAFIGIEYFWNIETAPDNISYIRRALIPIMVFIVPIMDTSFVTYARLARGSSPFVGGKDHLTHHLVHLGIPESLVPVTLGLVSVISGGLAMYIFGLIPEWSPVYSAIFLLYPVLLVGIFFILYKRGERIGMLKDKLREREARKQQQAS